MSELAIESAEVVLPTGDLEADIDFFVDRIGFRLDVIFPADNPTVAIISGHGVRLRLDRAASPTSAVIKLRLAHPDSLGVTPEVLSAPNGTRVEIVPAPEPLRPTAAHNLVVHKASAHARWNVGRAGMMYRDLLTQREGGHFIASHIRIAEGGPVSDYVHFHDIRFQMIFCYRGWVRLVYEDQGPPFVMHSGDALVQPPGIRHRVLECSPGLEVIELTSPAEHPTYVDHDLILPTRTMRPERRFSGQRFTHHRAADAHWERLNASGFEARNLGFEQATGALASAEVMRPAQLPAEKSVTHSGELLFGFVLEGSMKLHTNTRPDVLGPGDCFVIPTATPCRFEANTADLNLLEVRLPAS